MVIHLSTLLEARDTGPGWQVPAGRLDPPLFLPWPYLGTVEGGAVPGRRQGSRALGWGHVHLPGKDIISPCQVLQDRPLALCPAVTSQDREFAVLSANLGAGSAGLRGPFPGSSRLPSRCPLSPERT